MAQGGRWSADLKQGGGHFQPAIRLERGRQPREVQELAEGARDVGEVAVEAVDEDDGVVPLLDGQRRGGGRAAAVARLHLAHEAL